MDSIKKELHPRNRHKGFYKFKELVESCPDLAKFIKKNNYGNESIDFSDPAAVKTLNKALLKSFYGVVWDLPEPFLCPPIPGRADYIHYIADLLGVVPQGKTIFALDIGVGANCIYPLIGHKEYGWHFVGSEVNPAAFLTAQEIVKTNHLTNVIEIRLQKDPLKIFKGILKEGEAFDVCLCNPPFHASEKEALAGTKRKWRNLGKKTTVLNFGGQSHELWYPGGEVAFIKKIIQESADVPCKWFTTLVSKESSLPSIYKALSEVKPLEVKEIKMGQGQKKSRLMAWTFTLKTSTT